MDMQSVGECSLSKFPSPTGVNYYESRKGKTPKGEQEYESFRPQQGLTIMNLKFRRSKSRKRKHGFRPQQGLTIMNRCCQH